MNPTPPTTTRFSVLDIGVEIRGPGAALLAQAFDFYTGRPDAESTRHSLILDLQARAPWRSDLPAGLRGQERERGLVYRQGKTKIFDEGRRLLFVDRDAHSTFARLVGKNPGPWASHFLESEIRYALAQRLFHSLPCVGFGIGGSSDALLLFLPRSADPFAVAEACLAREGFSWLGKPLLGPIGQVRPLITEAHRFAPRFLPRPSEQFRARYLVWASAGRSGDAATLVPLPKWQAAPRLLRDLAPRSREDLFGFSALNQASRTGAASLLLAAARAYRLRWSRDLGENADALMEGIRANRSGMPAPLRLS